MPFLFRISILSLRSDSLTLRARTPITTSLVRAVLVGWWREGGLHATRVAGYS